MPYLVGQTYTTSIDVTNAAGNPATPSGVTLTIQRLGTADAPITPSITPAAHMTYDQLLTAEGLWRFDWVPVNPGAPQTEFVTCRAFRSCITLDEARDYLGVLDTRTDRKLQSLMMTSTVLAEKVVGTIVPTTFTSDWVTGTSRPIIKLSHAPLLTATSVSAIRSIYPGGPQWDSTGLICNPQVGTVYPADMIDFWLGPWTADYQAGRLIPSENIINGVREILWDLWAIHRNLYGDSDMPQLDEVAAFEAQIPRDYQIPGRAAELLEGDRLPAFG